MRSWLDKDFGGKVAIISSRTRNTKVEISQDIVWAINNLKWHLLKYETKNLINVIKSVRDIYQYRHTLKKVKSSDKAVECITDIILAAIRKTQRFRTLDCLKVLRSLVKNIPEDNELSERTVAKLFEVYKHFVFSHREDVQWCVSSIIKDKKLSGEAIDWLIGNQSESTHIVNRLLLYPCPHPQIKNWAEQVLSKSELSDRRSDLIAILIEKDLPKAAAKDSSSTIQWAIFKSRLPCETKINLLNQYSDFDSLQATIEIAERLNSPDILRSLLKKIEGMNDS
ncbi:MULTISPECIES: hypothetical protein [Trichocoleus]|uniref:Uncharacterized protein n=1 Tax=Trichocoleus desertorum GB2-A4 TaxID=2933944 RepID=A0ABV0JBJ9_9CYAN|nr:hypothetical protein [Trichocoleus sp. FACHB-46]MBD1860955.1 hypothetical protein [Trichocoleus sp. FACHB-46]